LEALKLETEVIQYKSDSSGSKEALLVNSGKKRKRDKKKLCKLKEQVIEGFYSCSS
jgi:hypothetical protein